MNHLKFVWDAKYKGWLIFLRHHLTELLGGYHVWQMSWLSDSWILQALCIEEIHKLKKFFFSDDVFWSDEGFTHGGFLETL